jgi:LysM repeat protein
VSHVPAAALADQARKHLGEGGPINTCVSNGPEHWARELGLPILGTASVREYVRLAQAGTKGYTYHDGTNGLARGYIAVWTHEALGSTLSEHVCVIDEVKGNLWRGIGSGTPNGTVARQPASGGLNPKSVLRGYIVAPTETGGHVVVKPPVVKPSTHPDPAPAYTIKRGDTLTRIASKHHTTVAKILKANPPKGNKSADFHILRANLIIVGQKIRIP